MSLLCNAVGLVATGYAFDRGLRALCANSAAVVVGAALGFAVFKGVTGSLAAAWGFTCLLHFFVGCGMACLGLPLTRIYEPLEVGWRVAGGGALQQGMAFEGFKAGMASACRSLHTHTAATRAPG